MRTITRIEVANVSMRFDGDGEGISEDTLYYILVCTAYVGIKIKISFFFAKPCPIEDEGNAPPPTISFSSLRPPCIC